MNRFLSLALTTALVCPAASVMAAAQEQQQTSQEQQKQSPSPKLVNQDVSEMLKAGLSAEIVIAKIRSSATAFDTSAAALQEMKAAGVPDAVILAMVEAPAGGGPAATMTTTAPAAVPVEVKVPDGTEVEIELINVVTGEEVKVGSLVDFKVIHPVVLNGVVIFERDASARARITTAKKAGRWGRAGKLEWAMQDVQAADGNRVPMRFTDRALGDSKGGTVAVAAVATTVLLGPVGLLWGLKKGKPAVIPAGNRYRVFVHGDTAIKGKPVPAAAGS